MATVRVVSASVNQGERQSPGGEVAEGWVVNGEIAQDERGELAGPGNPAEP
jgi:hypothetical protein